MLRSSLLMVDSCAAASLSLSVNVCVDDMDAVADKEKLKSRRGSPQKLAERSVVRIGDLFYTVGKKLGAGGFGAVHAGERSDGLKVRDCDRPCSALLRACLPVVSICLLACRGSLWNTASEVSFLCFGV